MSATRKDFVKIAASVSTTLALCETPGERAVVCHLARNLAVDLRGMNSNFDRYRFLSACGLTLEEMDR